LSDRDCQKVTPSGRAVAVCLAVFIAVLRSKAVLREIEGGAAAAAQFSSNATGEIADVKHIVDVNGPSKTIESEDLRCLWRPVWRPT